MADRRWGIVINKEQLVKEFASSMGIDLPNNLVWNGYTDIEEYEGDISDEDEVANFIILISDKFADIGRDAFYCACSDLGDGYDLEDITEYLEEEEE